MHRTLTRAEVLRWMVYDPGGEGWTKYDDEADARKAFAEVVDWLRGESAEEGWNEDAECASLMRCTVVQRLKLVTTATSADDSEGGEWCRANGWDFLADGEVEDVADPVGAQVAQLAEQVAALTAERDAARRVLLVMAAACQRAHDDGDLSPDDALDVIAAVDGAIGGGISTWAGTAAALRKLCGVSDV